jgi:hypothetical protein
MAAWTPFNTTYWGMLSQPDKQKLPRIAKLNHRERHKRFGKRRVDSQSFFCGRASSGKTIEGGVDTVDAHDDVGISEASPS